ncbi:MAG: hypothetical protein EAZ90_04695 [Oscillatoriales cyanobacterium]|nr:MAG: hypothetical protein EAZ94_05150 [Oscillatoriales cyanobacterium]TAE27202.1 MAG: hypothetical protein EAZ93_06095 [Oscillatoriales cyanobacterium]TAE44794.1 MAG: hypothetical protein EAZ90_04695 [Oscillatoriales cyanobacterium]TAE56164.1 MAG: hypothetical protein EAZ88_04750 [Oscillatoriales cyanobacterium]TAE66871.1 MAG: hypothetical protein EAZ86_18725 [Oscillatoriales cyanobacterium]
MSNKDRKLNNLHKFVGWASRPSFLDGRDAHPTRTIKIISYFILIPKRIQPSDYSLGSTGSLSIAKTPKTHS